MSHGEVREDAQRDMEYTRLLGEKIVERYHVENRVFSSHLVAFAAFEILKRRNRELDLYGLLRLPPEERVFSLKEYAETVGRLLSRLREMVDQGKVHLAEHMVNDTMTIIEHGIKNLGIYHAKRALTFHKDGTIVSEDMNLLYYYHNRLEGYELEAYVS
jgi:glycerol-3-phosphate O-acyltransferase